MGLYCVIKLEDIKGFLARLAVFAINLLIEMQLYSKAHLYRMAWTENH